MPYRQNNYSSFAIDSSFNPLSMQEMLQPFVAYKDAYEKTEEAYYDLSDKADKFKYLSKTLPEGSEARQIYEGYVKDLTQQAESLAKHGLSMNNRRALTDLKRRYKGEIGRLDEADTRRRAQIEEQRKLILQDPTRMFSREAAMTTLDEYLNNPELNYKNYSGALLAQQVGQAASNIAKSLRNYGKGEALDGYTKTWLQEHGYTAEQVAQAIADPMSDKTGVLSSIVEQAIQSSGIPKWADNNTLKQAYDYARQGLWNAVGQTTAQTYTDEAAKAALTHYYHELEADNAATRAAEQARQQRESELAGGLAINPINIYNAKEQEQTAKNMRDYAKYFTTDSNGRTVLNKEGLEEYNRNATPKVSTAASGSGTARLMNAETQLQNDNRKYTPTEFRKFVDNELSGSSFMEKKQYGNLGNRWNQYNKNNSSSKYDSTRSTEFDYTITDAQQKDFKSAIQTAARGTELQEVDFDSKTNTFKPSGGKLSMSDLNDDKYAIVSTRFSPYGSTVMIKDKNGEVHRYKMPSGINTTNEANRDLAMQYAQSIQNAFSEYSQKGYYTDTKGNKITPTKEEMAKLAQEYKKYVQMAYLYHSQLGVQNKTKEQEFNPYSF